MDRREPPPNTVQKYAKIIVLAILTPYFPPFYLFSRPFPTELPALTNRR